MKKQKKRSKRKNGSGNLLEGSQNRLASSCIMGQPVASDAVDACAFGQQFVAISGV